MAKIDWKAKLSSRKFWAAVTGFVTSLATALGSSQDSITQIVGLIMAGATVIAYILAEGFVDAKAVGSQSVDKEGE